MAVRMTSDVLKVLGDMGTLGYECGLITDARDYEKIKLGERPDVEVGFVGNPQSVIHINDYLLVFSNKKDKPVSTNVHTTLEKFKTVQLFKKGKVWAKGPGGTNCTI